MDRVISTVTGIQREVADIHLNPEDHGVSAEVIQKDRGKDYTTAVDRKVEEFQRRRLNQEFPEIGFLGEESGGDSDKRYIWIVDPTDGTAVYATGGTYYSNSTALIDREKQTVPFGSVFQSATGKQFVRSEGKIWISEPITDKGGTQRTIERKPVPSTSEGAPELLGCAFGTSKHYSLIPGIQQALEGVFEKTENPGLKRRYGMINARPASGSSALFCSDIADGNRHFALLYFQKAWDLAVGALYARDAGCIVTSGDSIETLTEGNLEKQIAGCDKKTLINVGIFANKAIQEAVMSKLEQTL